MGSDGVKRYNFAMDELDLARRAVRRGSLSEEQLREAQSFASGGRSLLAVLLDLGYLRPQEIADLALARAPESRKRSWGATVALVLGTVGATLAVTRGCSGLEADRGASRDEPFRNVVHEFRPAGPALGSVLLEKALENLSLVEADRKTRAGPLDPAQEKRVRHANELLEEAITEGGDGPTTWTALGRAHELLDHWEDAAQWYRKSLDQDDQDAAANLGLSRVLLLLDRPIPALTHSSIACQGVHPGEAYLVRARVNMTLGKKSAARSDLDRALELDPQLRGSVRALQQRLDE